MEGISQLVSDSLARNGVQPSFDHLRLDWSRWIRCESSFSVLLVPAKPGIFALAEEIVSPLDVVELRAPSPVERVGLDRTGGKRMLALFEVREADDLGMALGRLFLPGNSLRDRLAAGKCFARYTVIEDSAERAAAYKTLERWLQETAGTSSYQDVA